jgi:hypothetical protein
MATVSVLCVFINGTSVSDRGSDVVVLATFPRFSLVHNLFDVVVLNEQRVFTAHRLCVCLAV